MHETVIQMLEGNTRHIDRMVGEFQGLHEGQEPDVVTVCCGDSRVLQEAMWETEHPGEMFTHSNIGNRVTQETESGTVVSGDVLYPLVHTGTETAVVVGHTGCGAVTTTYKAMTGEIDEPPGINYCVDALEAHLDPGLRQLPEGLTDQEAVSHLVEYNVDKQVEVLTESDDVPESVSIFGTVYDFQDVYSSRQGAIHVVNVDGEREVERLREAYPDIESRIGRYWEY